MQYQIPLLSQECTDSLIRNLSISNAAKCFHLSDYHRLPALTKASVEFIAQNKLPVLHSNAWSEYISPNVTLLESLYKLLAKAENPSIWKLEFDSPSLKRAFSSRKHVHQRQLLDCLSVLQFDQTTADTTLVTTVDDCQFKVHKIILCLRSKLFEELFQGAEEEEKRSGQRRRWLEIDDVTGDVMRALLKYIYTADVGEVDGIAAELFETAGKVRQRQVLCV